MTKAGILTGFVVFAVCGLASVAEGGETGTVVLDSSGFWRVHCTLRTPVTRKGAQVTELEHKMETALPPEGWAAPGFDDSSWRRLRGHPFPFVRYTYMDAAKRHLGSVYYHDGTAALALLCMRGAFNVTDPARVAGGGMSLDVAYRGGVVVRLNGKEIARGHLAEAGPLALANDYPPGASFDAAGKLLTNKKDTLDRLSKRTRKLAGVKVPAGALRRGRNVLAIEIHRSAFAPEVVEKIMKEKHKAYTIWSTCALVGARLVAGTAGGGGGAEPNAVRPKGVQVWNSDNMSPDFDLDFGCRTDNVRPVNIVGTRNGAFSGKVVVGSDAALKGVSATMSELARKGGGRIPSSAVQVRYALPTGSELGASGRYPARPSRFDALAEEPPAEVAVRTKKKTRDNWVRPGQPKVVFGAVLPVWVTVNVPADARPGEYEGTLTVRTGAGAPVRVPVKLDVSGWRLPDPKDFGTYVELIQSPDTVAMKYKAKPWSDEHFALMAQSLKLTGLVGNESVYVPLITKTNLGNPESMVRWVKKPGGGYSYDLSIMKRYLDMAEKHQGRPSLVCLYVWDVFLEGGFLRYAKTGRYARPDIHGALAEFQGKGPRVTAVEGASGKVSELQLPLYSKPEGSGVHWKRLGHGPRHTQRLGADEGGGRVLQEGRAGHSVDEAGALGAEGRAGGALLVPVPGLVAAVQRLSRHRVEARLEAPRRLHPVRAERDRRVSDHHIPPHRRDEPDRRPARLRALRRRLLAGARRQARPHGRHALQPVAARRLAQPHGEDHAARAGAEGRRRHGALRDAPRGRAGVRGADIHRARARVGQAPRGIG